MDIPQPRNARIFREHVSVPGLPASMSPERWEPRPPHLVVWARHRSGTLMCADMRHLRVTVHVGDHPEAQADAEAWAAALVRWDSQRARGALS